MRTILAFLATLLIFGNLRAAEDPAHDELRALRTEIIDAVTRGDINSVLLHVHPDVVITWQDNQVCHGRDGLKSFFEKSGKDTFKGYKVQPTPDGLTLLHGGDTGISTGETVAAYTLLGKEYEMHSRWTATLVKEDGQWLLAGYHISMNVLDNPLLNAAKSSLIFATIIAGLLGAGIGLVLSFRTARKLDQKN